MKNFIVKVLFFTLPFFTGHIGNVYLGSRVGDLLRRGTLINQHKNYRNIFDEYFLSDITYSDFLSTKNANRQFTVLTIGDSFSGQGNIGYQNFLTQKDSISVLHFNQRCNSIEMIYGFLNGNIFDSIKVDYVILQSVERGFVNKTIRSDSTYTVNFDQVLELERKYREQKKEGIEMVYKAPRFFSKSTVTFPLFNLLYYIDDNAFYSDTYKVSTCRDFFSIEQNELLFYKDDLRLLESNNNFYEIEKANYCLNKIAENLDKKKIKLIVLISPDKYDLYYKYIEDYKKYPEPLFFNQFDKVHKNYKYVNAKKILSDAVLSNKDIYFYDDTHWSPLASELIASEIYSIIQVEEHKARTHNILYR